jgi:hypothetical protein
LSPGAWILVTGLRVQLTNTSQVADRKEHTMPGTNAIQSFDLKVLFSLDLLNAKIYLQSLISLDQTLKVDLENQSRNQPDGLT